MNRHQGESPRRVAVVYGTAPGIGGLGLSVSAGISAAADGAEELFALGRGAGSGVWSLPCKAPQASWMEPPRGMPAWMIAYSWLRYRPGFVTLLHDRQLGRWAADQLERLDPQTCYLFTQVALESLGWCRRKGVPTVLDNPNGHIRNFQQVYERESQRWCGKKFYGHPTREMVERVEMEYQLADRIRVYSHWAKASMMRFGVPEEKIQVLRQTVNLEQFCPPALRPAQTGPLRVCYAGSLDLRKGFVYLLQAIRMVGAQHIHLRIAGATGDRGSARLFARERAGLQIEAAPGASLPVYQQSELLVVPTLEDGFSFVVVEGLACGLPVIVTSEAGASECVRDGQTGWIVPPANSEALAEALEQALQRRSELPNMGQNGRADVEQCAGMRQLKMLADWFYCRAEAAVRS